MMKSNCIERDAIPIARGMTSNSHRKDRASTGPAPKEEWISLSEDVAKRKSQPYHKVQFREVAK